MAGTVYILGAGASAASDHALPTLNGFFDIPDGFLGLIEADEPRNMRGVGEERLYTFLEKYYGDTDPRMFNLEEVLAHVYFTDLRAERWLEPSLRRRLPDLTYPELIDYVQRRLDVPPELVCTRHRRLFSQLGADDTVLTLNYDLIGDQTLLAVEGDMPGSRLGTLAALISGTSLDRNGQWAPALHPSPSSRGLYLKLHGSLNWFTCTAGDCENSRRLYVRTTASTSSCATSGMSCNLCGSPLTTFLVPPLASKSVDGHPKMRLLWVLALHALTMARRIVVVGVSFAHSDVELRWLLRLSRERGEPPAEVVFVNPDRESWKRGERLLCWYGLGGFPAKLGWFPPPRCYDSLEDYLKSNEEGPSGA